MRRLLACLLALCTLIPIGFARASTAQSAENRIALVIGNDGYQAGALKTSANDAGLIAQTLQAAGFDVVGARNLDEETLRRALRDFLSKASSSGQDTVALIYLSGYGLQLEGENYFLPVDAKITRAAEVAAQALRLSDYIRPLASLKLKASIVVLDAARRNPFAISGDPLASGLALVEPGPGTLVAFNAAPGTIAPDEGGPYGAFARALSEMMREGGLSLPQVFERVRLRVSDMTKGAELPWFSSTIDPGFVFFERGPDAPAPVTAAGASAQISEKSIRELPAADAYQAAIARDTLAGYEEFVATYPGDPLAKRVRAILAARREAITWQRTYAVNTPNAYWSYLHRYPHGPHSADARRRLALGAFALEPPAAFDPIDYDVPPPSAGEEPYVDRPVLAFDDADLGFVPPPPLPVYFLPPPPPELIALPPPLPLVEEFVLPVPVFVPLPLWCDLPAYVAPPRNNVIFANIHNTIIIDAHTNLVTIRNQRGEIVSSERQSREPRGLEPRAEQVSAHDPGAMHLGRSGLSASLPASLAQKRAPAPSHETAPISSGTQHASRLPLGQPLPGMHGQPLPPLPRRFAGPEGLSSLPPKATPDSHAHNRGSAPDATSLPARGSVTGALGQSPVLRPPSPPLAIRAAMPPVVRPAAPVVQAAAPPVFHPPAPPVVRAAPPPVFRPTPAVRPAAVPAPAVVRRAPTAPVKRG